MNAPWIKAENSIKYYLRTYFKNVIDTKTYKKITPKGSSLGKLYGLAKAHKANCPLRPVNSMIGTPEYHFAKFLDSKLKPFIPDKFSVNSTEQFLKKLRSYKKATGDICVSFDVKSLFTNVPRAFTIERICEFFDKEFDGAFLQEVDEKGKTSKVDSTILKKALEKCTKGHFFV